MQILNGRTPRPQKVILYGRSSIGKTTLASQAQNPILIDTDNGAWNIEGCAKTSAITSLADLGECLQSLAQGQNSYQTIVIDSLTKVTQWMEEDVCKKHNKPSIGSFAYGQGYAEVATAWEKFLNYLDRLSVGLGYNIVLVGHDSVKSFQDPMFNTYDQYVFDAPSSVIKTLKRQVDAILFASFQMMTEAKDKGEGNVAISSGQRIIYTEERPNMLAKNRVGLPFQMPMTPEVWQKLLTPCR